jgi:hypothetical protein
MPSLWSAGNRGKVKEPERMPVRGVQPVQVRAGGFQQLKRADDVGLDEFSRAVDGAVDMRLGCEIDDGAGPVLGIQPREQGRIRDVAAHENMPWVVCRAGQVGEIAGIGQFVEVDHRRATRGQPVEHEIAADKAGAAGY